MAATTPTTEPLELRAGDTWSWRREDLADYSADAGWVLTYHFRNATGNFDITASADGTAHAVSVAKATTAAYPPGDYDWVAVVADSTSRHEVDRGGFTVLHDYAAASPLDGRSFARRLLDYVEAELLSRGSSGRLDLINSAIADRSLTRDKAGLITLRSQLKAEIAREDNANRVRRGLASNNKLLVRFA